MSVESTQQQRSYACHRISGGQVEGELLFSADDLCFYLCDPQTGTVIEEGHDLFGQSVAGKILVFPSGKGSSVVQTDGLYQLRMHGNAPLAVVVRHPDTVLVATCIILDVPMIDRVDASFYAQAHSGEWALLDADHGRITVVEGGTR